MKRVFDQSGVIVNILVGTAFLHVLALAPTLYVSLVFSRYLSHGIDATLLTLTVGTLVAMTMEVSLRRARGRMLAALTARQDRLRASGVMRGLLLSVAEPLQALLAAGKASPLRALEQVQQAVTPANLAGLIDAPFFLLFWLVLMFMSWQLGIVALLTIAGAVGYQAFCGLRLRGAIHDMHLAALAQQTMLASAERAEAVRLANAGDYLAGKFEVLSGRARLARYRAADIQERMSLGAQLATGLMTLVTIGIGAKLATGGLMDMGALFGANILSVRMLGLALRPAQFLNALFQASEAQAVIDAHAAVPAETVEGTSLLRYEGRLEFKDLAFAYPGGTGPLFENLSLVLSAGDVLVVTGANGAGKTTFARQVAGLLSPTRGAILADGVDLRQFPPQWWRRQMVFVPQEPEFFDGTLAENLTTLAPDLPAEHLRLLIDQSGLAEFVDHHPRGLHMFITQGGRNLSLGIRRRLAVVRALTTRGRLVVVDEPMEGLDAQGCAIMNGTLTALRRQGCTMILCCQIAPAGLGGSATFLDLDAKPEPRIRFQAPGAGAP